MEHIFYIYISHIYNKIHFRKQSSVMYSPINKVSIYQIKTKLLAPYMVVLMLVYAC